MKRRTLLLAGIFLLLILGLASFPARQGMTEASPSTGEQVVTVPLFELRREDPGITYFYTPDPNEKATLQGVTGWHYLGITGYVIPNSKKIPGSVAMYRLTKQAIDHKPLPYSDKTFDKYFYTTDKGEADNAVNNLGWRLEGVAFYVSPKPALATSELYRLYQPYSEKNAPAFTYKSGDVHYYTTSKSTMETWSQAGWSFVRVEAYVWTKQTTLDVTIGLTEHTPLVNTGKAATDPDSVLLNLSCTRKAPGEYNCNNQRAYETCQSYKQKGVVKGCFTTVNPKVQEAMDKLLFSVGCSRFLGRADEFTCKTQKGLDLCETYRKNGTLKKCILTK